MTDSPSAFHLREGLPEDTQALAALHVEVWRDTYRAYAPQQALTLLNEDKRLPMWHGILTSQDPGIGAIVGLAQGQILGVVSFAPSMHPAMEGAHEITHLYVKGPARGTGRGKALLCGVLDRLSGLGARRAALAVVTENTPARRFYCAQGGTETGKFTDPGPLWRASNIVMSWPLDPKTAAGG